MVLRRAAIEMRAVGAHTCRVQCASETGLWEVKKFGVESLRGAQEGDTSILLDS